MKVYVGADHRGFDLKGRLVPELVAVGVEAVDLGPEVYDPDDDYNDIAVEAVHRVLDEESVRAVLICGSGEGEMMQANRFKGIRAVAPRTVEECKVARWHHDANILVIAAEAVADVNVVPIVQEFLSAPFSNEQRYINRIRKLDEVA